MITVYFKFPDFLISASGFMHFVEGRSMITKKNYSSVISVFVVSTFPVELSRIVIALYYYIQIGFIIYYVRIFL